MSKEAMKLALDYILAINQRSEFWLVPGSNLNKTVTALREALTEQPTQSDPCPGCRKGVVCRTPQCGRLKLPVDHPFRAEQSAQQDDSVVFGVDRAPAQKRPQNCGTGYCSCIECVMEPAQRKPLTDEEIYDMYNEPRSDAEMLEFARAIEAAHGIKEKNT